MHMHSCRMQKSMGVGVKVLGTFVPGSKSSREQKFHGMELSLPGAKVLRRLEETAVSEGMTGKRSVQYKSRGCSITGGGWVSGWRSVRYKSRGCSVRGGGWVSGWRPDSVHSDFGAL